MSSGKERKVKNPTELAQELAYRARDLRRLAVKQLEDEPEAGPLRNLYNAFKEALVHDQTEDEFGDAFAQTITYGLLTARWTGNDSLMERGERFTRQTALMHLPAASPFLNDFFRSALSVRLDDQRGRLLWLVDDIADLLDRVDVTHVFGIGDEDSDAATDPVIHFYEPFLAAYDKDLKNKRGVFFTPRPIVSYIVRSVHELLKKEFGLEDGLASTDTWGDVASRVKGLKRPTGVRPSDPFVCILDPATGTGTFLCECIDLIERTMKGRWRRELDVENKNPEDVAVLSRWNDYVKGHLLPSLYGYELMMAPYAIADLKISFKLRETGYQVSSADRLHLYLTNSLEPPSNAADPKLHTLFETLAREAREVNAVKARKQFTVVVGNPPYSASSWNTGHWIVDLTEGYKTTVRAEESQIQALSNDYIKFLRFGEWVVERTGVGILGMITGHGYLQGTQPRDMREHLLQTFAKCYCLDLHGSLRREGTADEEDEPVFQIMTGVAIIVAVRKAACKEVGKASLTSLTGSLESKFAALGSKTATEGMGASEIAYTPSPPYFFFSQPTTVQAVQQEYDTYLALPSIFGTGDRQKDKEVYWATGFASQQDELAMSFTREEVAEKMAALAQSSSFGALRERYRLCTTNQWNYAEAKAFAEAGEWRRYVNQVIYRPFDRRWTVLHKHVLTILRTQVMSQLGGRRGDNLGLVSSRAVNDQKFAHCFVVDGPADKIFISSKSSTNAYVFPLFVEFDDMYGKGHRPNFSRQAVLRLSKLLGKPPEASSGLPSGVSPNDLFNYVYAVLSSPGFRERYAEFLKIDFPKIPFPRDAAFFRELAELGGQLVECHLLRSDFGLQLAHYEGPSMPAVERPSHADRAVWLDKKRTRGFRDVPSETWSFLIGGYRVCEKWLKDRKGRTLTEEDIAHYQKIVIAISKTIQLMKEIDTVISNRGGWPDAFDTTYESGSTGNRRGLMCLIESSLGNPVDPGLFPSMFDVHACQYSDMIGAQGISDLVGHSVPR